MKVKNSSLLIFLLTFLPAVLGRSIKQFVSYGGAPPTLRLLRDLMNNSVLLELHLIHPFQNACYAKPFHFFLYHITRVTVGVKFFFNFTKLSLTFSHQYHPDISDNASYGILGNMLNPVSQDNFLSLHVN